MRHFSAQDLLWLWEVGQGQDALGRAMTILGAAFPEMSREALLDLGLGQQHARLLQVRQALFGPLMQCFSECPQCQERLEYTLDAAALADAGAGAAEQEAYETVIGEYTLRFRVLTCRDLAAVRACHDVQTARAVLAQHCLLQIERAGAAPAEPTLPEAVIVQLAEQVLARDPQAETLLNLECPTCGHGWQATLEYGTFLWAELSAQARRLLHEVDALARAYGWREADILSMSAFRRQMYLKLVI
jgi:hypothetical protein